MVEYFTAGDGVEIAYRSYAPSRPVGVVVFLHGGGAHSGAGYPATARVLAGEFSLVVVTPDLRGHGESGGRRGEAPSTGRLYDDLDELLELVGSRWPGLPVTLAGHSSGAGLIVNYVSRREMPREVSGYAFLAPFLGFRSETERSPNPRPFSSARTWPFVLNAMTGGLLLGNYHAVEFAYPEEILARDPLLLSSISVNVAKAVTPRNPRRDLARVAPLAIWIGSEDETVDSGKLAAFVADHAPDAQLEILPGVTHLGILQAGAWEVGQWILRTTSRPGLAGGDNADKNDGVTDCTVNCTIKSTIRSPD